MHAQCGGQYPGSGVGDAGGFECPLDLAVLSAEPVEAEEGDVEAAGERGKRGVRDVDQFRGEPRAGQGFGRVLTGGD